MTDLFTKFDRLIQQRAALLATGVTDPFSLVMEKVLSPTVAMCNGRETILLGTYNYMGMTFDEDVIAAGKDALERFGSGTTGSRVLNGTYQGHREVEDALKEFYGTSSAMAFSTGYQANLGMISTLAGRGDVFASALAQPQGKVILTMSGKIANTNKDGTAQFDLPMLEQLDLAISRLAADLRAASPLPGS